MIRRHSGRGILRYWIRSREDIYKGCCVEVVSSGSTEVTNVCGTGRWVLFILPGYVSRLLRQSSIRAIAACACESRICRSSRISVETRHTGRCWWILCLRPAQDLARNHLNSNVRLSLFLPISRRGSCSPLMAREAITSWGCEWH